MSKMMETDFSKRWKKIVVSATHFSKFTRHFPNALHGKWFVGGRKDRAAHLQKHRQH